jgi:hypothetical protein
MKIRESLLLGGISPGENFFLSRRAPSVLATPEFRLKLYVSKSPFQIDDFIEITLSKTIKLMKDCGPGKRISRSNGHFKTSYKNP